MSEQQFSVSLKLIRDYLFEIDFGDFGSIMTDEPEPLGSGEGPNPTRLLAAAVANCLAASLMFAIRKFKEDPGEVSAMVSGQLQRVEQRWRVATLDVTLRLGNNADVLPHVQKALEQFENFCVVTQSVRRGIAVNVTVVDSAGTALKSV